MLPAHAPVIHAILVDRLQAGIEEHVGHVFNAAKHRHRGFVFVIAWLEAHDANVFGAQAFHSRDGALDFGQGDFEGIADFLGPVHDRRAEAINIDPGRLEFSARHLKSFLGNVVEISLGKAWHLDAARLQMLPAQLAGGRYLAVDRVGCFIADAQENHG